MHNTKNRGSENGHICVTSFVDYPKSDPVGCIPCVTYSLLHLEWGSEIRPFKIHRHSKSGLECWIPNGQALAIVVSES